MNAEQNQDLYLYLFQEAVIKMIFRSVTRKLGEITVYILLLCNEILFLTSDIRLYKRFPE